MADARDILTEAEALSAVNISDAGDHAEELGRAVTAVSLVIDAACGPVVARTVTEIHAGGMAAITPYQWPVLSITSVTEFDGTTQTVLTNESIFGTAATAGGFLLTPTMNRLERHPGYLFASRVQLVYQAGRFADTASVDARWKYAASAVLQRLWKREGSAWAYSPDFFANSEEATASGQFFRAVRPMLEELLPDQLRSTVIG